ncbi:MAG: AraC family transcriptional regulator [Victivallales bacterium]|jgi:AraC-like DNA-binding protein
MKIEFHLPLLPYNAGLFISSGKGIHPTRTVNSCEIIFNVAGRLGMFEGNRKFDLLPNETLFLEAGKKHGGTRPYPGDLSFYWIHFLTIGNAKDKNRKFLQIPKKCLVSRPEKMIELFREYLGAQESGTLTEIQASSLICLMLSEISASAGISISSDDRKNGELAAKVKTLISSNIGRKELSTSWLAGKLRCNPDYMGRVFRNMHGKTVTDEIHWRKINAARRMLFDSSSSVKEIAASCGFSDTVYFRRIFRKITGFNPLAYRKQFPHMHVNTELK